MLVPFSESLSLVLSIPETALEDSGKTFVPLVFSVFRECAFKHTSDSFLVASYHSMDIFWTTCPSFDFENANPSLHQSVDEPYGLEVLRTHDIFVVYLKLVASLVVCCGI